jgi:aspartyl-tRNA(Asn)/glutamyl-tRNA(Gln) amidotransferase subunit A
MTVPMPALELGRRIAAGELDPVAVAQDHLAAAEEDAAAAVYIQMTAERALREASGSAARLRRADARGPLDGVPVAWKDLFDVAGTPTTAGSAIRRDAAPAAHDARCVARLAAAGLVCLGKTNLSEFAYSGLGLNPHFGTPRNPAAPGRVPGGSSSGSAAAVAGGSAACAIGTDTSGSVRIPAAFMGLAGYKPTQNRFSREGVVPLAPSLDSVGILARTAVDLPALDAALRGQPYRAPRPPEPSALRITVPSGELADDCTPAIRHRLQDVADRLAGAGVTVTGRPVTALIQAQDVIDRHGTLVAAEAYRTHGALLDDARGRLLDRRVRTRLEDGAAIPERSDLALRDARPPLQQAVTDELAGDLLLYPTVRHPPPELAPIEADDSLFAQVNRRTLRSTMLASYLDLPGIALPAGRDDEQQPISILVSAPPGHDDRLLAAALTIEQVLGPLTGPPLLDLPVPTSSNALRLTRAGTDTRLCDRGRVRGRAGRRAGWERRRLCCAVA